MFPEKRTPRLIQSECIGLDRVADSNVLFGVFPSQSHHAAVKVQPGKCGFAPLKDKRAAALGKLHGSSNHLFHSFK